MISIDNLTAIGSYIDACGILQSAVQIPKIHSVGSGTSGRKHQRDPSTRMGDEAVRFVLPIGLIKRENPTVENKSKTRVIAR